QASSVDASSSAGIRLAASASRLALQLFDKLGHESINVADEAEIGDVEDRRIGITIDGHNGARVLHSGQVLDRSGNAERDIKLRRHDFACLANLQLIRRDP